MRQSFDSSARVRRVRSATSKTPTGICWPRCIPSVSWSGYPSPIRFVFLLHNGDCLAAANSGLALS